MSITEDILVSYALGHLSPEEEAVVERHLGAHPEDAATVSGYLDSLSGLVMTLPPDPSAARGKTELLARVRSAGLLARVRDAEPTPESTSARSYAPTRELSSADATPPVVLPPPPPDEADPGRPSVLRRYGWIGALAAVAALLYLTLFPLDPDARAVRALQAYQARPGAATHTLEGAEAADPLGTLVQLQDGRVFVALGAPPAEGVYQAWAIGDAPVSLGTFDGRTFLSTGVVAKGQTFGLTLEPPGGSEQPTTTPLTLLEL